MDDFLTRALAKFVLSFVATFLLVGFVVLLVGCSPQRTNPAAATTPTNGPFSDFRAADDPKFSVEEQRMIAAARAYLEKRRGKAFDARYQVKGTKNGYEVSAMFVGAYENGQPLYFPGGHGTVILGSDGSFIDYMPGE